MLCFLCLLFECNKSLQNIFFTIVNKTEKTEWGGWGGGGVGGRMSWGGGGGQNPRKLSPWGGGIFRGGSIPATPVLDTVNQKGLNVTRCDPNYSLFPLVLTKVRELLMLDL